MSYYKSKLVRDQCRYEPIQIHRPVRVLEFGVLGFKTVLDLTGAAFLGAAGTRRVVRVGFGETTFPTCEGVFFKAFGLDGFRITFGFDSALPANSSLINLQASSTCWVIKAFCSGSARRCAWRAIHRREAVRYSAT